MSFVRLFYNNERWKAANIHAAIWPPVEIDKPASGDIRWQRDLVDFAGGRARQSRCTEVYFWNVKSKKTQLKAWKVLRSKLRHYCQFEQFSHIELACSAVIIIYFRLQTWYRIKVTVFPHLPAPLARRTLQPNGLLVWSVRVGQVHPSRAARKLWASEKIITRLLVLA